MQTEIIAPAEAWEAVDRLKIDISHNRTNGEFCASVEKPKFQVGWGKTPLEAVGNLLVRIGEVAPSLPVGVQNGLRKVEEMEQGREIVYTNGERA